LRKLWETEGPDNRLFNACFRIQREASKAAGRYIPMVVENVRGAQEWVGFNGPCAGIPIEKRFRLGRAKANYGSFYLFGDVDMVGTRVVIQHGKRLHSLRAPRTRSGRHDGMKGFGSTWFGIQNNGERYDQRTQNPVSGL